MNLLLEERALCRPLGERSGTRDGASSDPWIALAMSRLKGWRYIVVVDAQRAALVSATDCANFKFFRSQPRTQNGRRQTAAFARFARREGCARCHPRRCS